VPCLRACYSASSRSLIPLLSINRLNAPSARQYGPCTARAFCFRYRMDKPGTGPSSSVSFSRLTTIPASWRNGSLNSTLSDRQNGMAVSENTADRPNRPSRGAHQVMSLSSRISRDPRLRSDAL